MISERSSIAGAGVSASEHRSGNRRVVLKKYYQRNAFATDMKLTITTCVFIVAQLMAILPNTTATAIDTTIEYKSNLTGVDVDLWETRRVEIEPILRDVYATISKNMAGNSRKLNLEDFSWGIFSGSKGRLQGFGKFQLIDDIVPVARKRKLNLSFEFTVPALAATWEKSVCLGYSCVVSIELEQATFALRVFLDAEECVFEHVAYLKNYSDARCIVSYLKTSPIPDSFVQGMVNLLSQVMNTQPFQKIVKGNVDYALLHLPLFNATDIQRICQAYRQI